MEISSGFERPSARRLLSDLAALLRHLENESRLVRIRSGAERAAMCLCDLRGNIEPEPQALLAGAVSARVRLEQGLHRLSGYRPPRNYESAVGQPHSCFRRH